VKRRHAHAFKGGLSLVEVIVVLCLMAATALVLLVWVAHAREQARFTGCRRNLGQVGIALAIFDQIHQHLPEVQQPRAPYATAIHASPAPLLTLLETLELPDLTELHDVRTRPARRAGQVPGDIPVPGFVCGSDPNAHKGFFRAPISYRAVTGDNPFGDNGAFAAGRKLSLAAVEAGDGLAYTAGFSERLVGDNQAAHEAPCNYQVVPAPLAKDGCPVTTSPSSWRGDAGSSWRVGEYRSTLYNHALAPNARQSCIGVDGQAAFIGASSGHVRGINLLLLDGSVAVVRSTINRSIWKEYARIGPSRTAEP
jgi:hypothetical protein